MKTQKMVCIDEDLAIWLRNSDENVSALVNRLLLAHKASLEGDNKLASMTDEELDAAIEKAKKKEELTKQLQELEA